MRSLTLTYDRPRAASNHLGAPVLSVDGELASAWDTVETPEAIVRVDEMTARCFPGVFWYSGSEIEPSGAPRPRHFSLSGAKSRP